MALDLQLLCAMLFSMAGRKIELGPTGVTVAANARRLREAERLSFTEVSARLEAVGRLIPPLAVRRVEDGDRRVDVDDLVALAVVLGVNPNALLLPPKIETEEPGPAEATGSSEATAADLWLWAEGWEALPIQRGAAEVSTSGTARGRAMYEQEHGFANRTRPEGDDRDLYDFLRRLRRLAADAAENDDRITLWSSDGYQVAGYPPAPIDTRDVAGALVEQLRTDVLNILRSPAVAPLRQSILAELESDADASRGDD